MKTRNCCLTLVGPISLEEELVDHLLEHPEWITGFTTERVDGLGQAMIARGTAELVRGRSGRIMVHAVMHDEDARLLLAHLKSALPNHEVAYWIQPVAEFGRFA